MSGKGDKGVSPRVLIGITAKIARRVQVELEHALSDPATTGAHALPTLGSGSGSSERVVLSSEEQSMIGASTEHFLLQQRINQIAVSENHLMDLARMLANSIASQRKQNRRCVIPCVPQPATASPRRPTDTTPVAAGAVSSSPRASTEQQNAAQSDNKAVPSSLPPLLTKSAGIVSPRKPRHESLSSAAPFATEESVVAFQQQRATRAENVRVSKAALSAELESQLQEKAALKDRLQREREREREARIDDLGNMKHIEASVKKTRKQLNSLLSDEYSHYANLRSLDEQKGKLEKMLENHLYRKQVQAELSSETALEERRRKQAETASYLAHQSEQESARRKAAAQADHAAVAAPFFIGESDEEVRRKAQLRKMSLAQGLEMQLQQRAQQLQVAS
jgi:hypothetical protein